MHRRTTYSKTWPNPRHPWIVLCSDALLMTLSNKNYRYICRTDSTNSHGVYYMGLNLQVMMNLMNSLHSYRCVFALFLQGWYWSATRNTVPQGRFFVCLNTSGCYILILYCLILLFLFDDLFCMSGMGWIVMIMIWWTCFAACCFCSAFASVIFYYLPRVKPGNYSICLCRSVWDMASFLSYTLGQSSRVKLTCLFTWLIDRLIDWLANGLSACGQRGKATSRLVGWLVDFDVDWFDDGVDVDTKYLLLTTHFLDLDLDQPKSVHSFEYISFVWEISWFFNFSL